MLGLTKRQAKGFVLTLEGILAPLASRIAKKAGLILPKKNSALILPCCPQEQGSLGDLTALESIAHALKEGGCEHVDLLRFGPDTSSVTIAGIDEQVTPPDDLRWHRIGGKFRLGLLLANYESYYAWGADVIDGVYGSAVPLAILRTVRLASMTGLDARILGFSWSTAPAPAICQEIDRLKHVAYCVREPFSKARFEKQTGRSAIQVADVAFLFHPSETSPGIQPIVRWLEEQSNSSNIVLGVNLSLFALGIQNEAEARGKVQMLAEALDSVKASIPNLKVLPVPHDIRESSKNIGDADLAEFLRLELQERSFGSIPSFPKSLCPSDVDCLVRRCDAVFAGRMHLSIAALRNCVPVLCMTYQDKFEGMLKLFELEDCALREDECVSETNISKRIANLITERDALSARIRNRLPYVKQLAERNFI